MTAGGWFLDAAIATGFFGLVAGTLVPAIIGRIPEPAREAETEQPPNDEVGGGSTGEASERKELYVDIARLPGLRWKCSLVTAVVAALIGSRVGFGPELSFLLYLAVVGVALALVDWRTRLLPTKVLAPSYLVVVVFAAVSSLLADDWTALVTAAWGWLIAGGTFFVLWFIYPRGMGYGDVRLSGILGIALGWLGWGQLLTGIYAGFLIGGVGGLLLSKLKIVDRKAYPFGPFMLVGALVGVLFGPNVAAWYV